jgi:hypothetical protein
MDASREDAKYWALDRISTFLESDIQNNERLKRKFIEAGYGSLFRLNLEPEGPVPETMKQADAMVKYFGLDEEEEGTMARQHDSTKERWHDRTRRWEKGISDEF